MRRRLAAMLACAALAGCQSTVNGPSRLEGQNLDAAVALYGPWSEQTTISGRPLYIWRRTLVEGGQPRVCELRLEVGFRNTVSRAYMQGIADACRLFALKEETLTR